MIIVVRATAAFQNRSATRRKTSHRYRKSCGNPISFAALKTGEVVVDLGSGGGVDCFLASKIFGPTGKVIGVDMTPEMI